MLRNEAVTCAADLWALGCLTFQMLVGRPPFRDSCEYLTLERVAARSFAFPASFPADARDLVDQLLVDEPCERLGEHLLLASSLLELIKGTAAVEGGAYRHGELVRVLCALNSSQCWQCMCTFRHFLGCSCS